jgi:hypothetical protein
METQLKAFGQWEVVDGTVNAQPSVRVGPTLPSQ